MTTWTTPQIQRADVSAFLMRSGDGGYPACACACGSESGSGSGQ